MTSVSTIIEVLQRMNGAAIAVRHDRCVQVRNRNASCRRCAEACTSGCLSLDGGELAVDPALCVGCGTCATVCPSGALEARDPVDGLLLGACAKAAEAAGGLAVIACATLAERAAGLYDPQKVAVTPCLGRVDESLLATLACGGATRIVLAHDDCAACALRPGCAVAGEVAATAGELFSAWRIPAQVELAARLPGAVRRAEEGFDQARRAFLGATARRGRRVAAQAAAAAVQGEEKAGDAPTLSKVGEDGTLPHRLPARRRRLLGVLGGWGQPDDVMVSTRLWGHVVVDADRCRSCQMCAVFCPTGALSKAGEDGAPALAHDPAICVKCRTCEAICPADALSLSDEVFARDVAERVVERIPLRPPTNPPGQENSVRDALRELLGVERIY